MEERKSMGEALINVFDAGVILVKAEINSLIRKLTEQAKVKGLGIVFIFAALIPLSMMLIFLILGIFFTLNLWLPMWGSAFLMALVGGLLTALLIWLGLQKLQQEIKDTDAPSAGGNGPVTPVTPPSAGPTPTVAHANLPKAEAGAVKMAVPAGATTVVVPAQPEHSDKKPAPAPVAVNTGSGPLASHTPKAETPKADVPKITPVISADIQPELTKPLMPAATGNQGGVKLGFPEPNTPAQSSRAAAPAPQPTQATSPVPAAAATTPQRPEPFVPNQVKSADKLGKPAGIPVSTKPTYKDEMGED